MTTAAKKTLADGDQGLKEILGDMFEDRTQETDKKPAPVKVLHTDPVMEDDIPEPAHFRCVPDDYVDTESEWMSKVKAICTSLFWPALVSVLMVYGVLSGNVAGEFGWPISWGCSGIALFISGMIVSKK